MKDSIELWLCIDCTILEVNDDATGFDDDARVAECYAALHALKQQGDLTIDSGDGQYECRECGQIGDGSDFDHAADEEGDACRVCPNCQSTWTRERDNGQDDFSWNICDCCDTHLGGARERFALFPKEEST